MSNLNEQQFARYSGIEDPFTGKISPLPASMERHGAGSYQPTLPGMEKMLPNERTHVDVVFNHPSEAERYTYADGTSGVGEVKHSKWGYLTRNHISQEVNVRASSLRPSQDWLDENYLNSPIHGNTLRNQGTTPKVEFIHGKKNVIQDGHHRAARAILKGEKTIPVERWGGKKFGYPV